jgi:SPP1 gp7 family putative phage head morphogenesis protein
LNTDLLTTILGDVKGAMAEGYGDSFYNYDANAKNKLQLKQNLYRFSGAKTYQEIAKMNYFQQQTKSFADFKKEALKINKEYNVQYLETEYVNANRQGTMAEKWHKAVSQKDLYPNLQYKTVKDARVREEHAQLHDVIKPIDDAFWDTWLPQNGHRCRCYVVQTDSAVTPGEPKGNPTPGFHGNVGKSNMAFNEDEHPYFIFPAADAKKIKASFEDMKISTPDYNLVHTNKKATLEVSTWADPKDIELNHKYAKTLVDKLGVSVKLRPHSEIEKTKNPEYLINGFTADLKSPESNNGITKQFKRGKEQMGTISVNYSIVFNLDQIEKLDHTLIITQIENKVSANRGKKITSLFFIRGGKAVELTREQVLKKDYTQLKSLK